MFCLSNQPRLPALLLSFLLLILPFQAGMADVLVWDADAGGAGLQDGAGAWNLGQPNWFNQTQTLDNQAWVDGSDAIFGVGSGAVGTVTLGGPITVGSLTFNAPGSGNYTIAGNTLTLGGSAIVANVNAAISSVLAGTSGLVKTGSGTLTLSGASTYTGATTVLGGAVTIASGGSIGVASATAGSLQIAERSTATLTVEAGGSLKVGSGSGSLLYVGSRGNVSGSAATVGTLDLSAASSFTADVGRFYVGVGETSNAGITRGIVHLAGSNTITASESIIVADMVPSLDNSNATAGVSQLNFGSGGNDVTTPLLIIGGSRSRATSTLAAGGTLTLNNGAGTTTLHIGRNNVTSTATTSEGTLDLTAGTFIATLGEVIIGARVGGTQSNTGRGVGTLSLGGSALNSVTADSLTLGSLGASGGSTNVTEGTLNMGGGSFTVTNDVSLADHTANGGFTRGTLNLTGGSFSVGGNITKANKTVSTAVIVVDGAALDMTGGSITSSQLAFRGGSISNVTSVTLDANNATTGAGDTGDALIFGDVDIHFDVTLSGASGGGVHYEAGTSAGGATISGNIALGSVSRIFNIEDNANAVIDTNVTGILSGAGGFTKTGAGTLRLSNANTHEGATTISNGLLILDNALALQSSTVTLDIADGLQFVSGITDFTFGSLAGGVSGVLMLEDAASQAVNLSVGGNNASSTYSGAITGAGTLTKTGTGTLTLAGSAANTYTGLTTVSNGAITVSKSTGVNAVAGNISLLSGGSLRFNSSNTNQLADNVQVTIDGNNSTFNGTGSNANAAAIIETIASLTVTRGVVNAGANSQFVVTGASSFTGTTGTTTGTSTMFIGNSSSVTATGSLSLTDMTGAGGTSSANSFTVFGNSDAIQTTLQIGSGGLILNNSNLYLNKGTNPNTLGSRLILDGDITVVGASPSAIIFNSGTLGQSEIELGSTAGTVTRTIDTQADLSINPDINNGAATTANITKTGAGTLTLGGDNSYTGHTQVNAGTLSFATGANLGDASATNTLGLGSGAILQFTGADITDLTANRDLLLASGAATLEVTQSTGNLVLSGDVTGAGSGTFSKTGVGTLTLAGSDLSGLGGRGFDLAAGGLSFQSGAGVGIDLGAGALHLADQTSLTLEVGSGLNYDFLKTTAAAVVDANATIHLNVLALDGIAPAATYDLLTGGAGSGFDAAGLTWLLNVSGSFKYQLNTTDTVVQLQTLSAVTGDAYWHGDFDGSWSSVVLGATNDTNWATDGSGTTDREAGPGAATTVYFSNANAAGPVISTTLDNDFTINNLVFLGSPAGVTQVAIAQGVAGMLTLAPSSSADGIRVEDNAGAVTISAPVRLGAAQTWEVSGTGASLVVSGQIMGEAGAALTKTGAGTLTLSGSNTYTGQTIVQQGTLAINSETRLGANPATFVAGQLTLDGGTLQTTGSLTINDANRGILLGAGGGSFNVNSGTTLTMGNAISGAGTLTKRGTGTLTMAGASTYTGDTTVLTGTLRIASGGSIGVAGATAGSLQIGETSTGTVIVEAGGELRVGSGSSSSLLVGTRTTLSGTTTGTLNMSAAASFTANVGLFQVGGSTSTSQSTSTGTAAGTAILAQNNSITATTGILVAEMAPAVGNTGVTSTLTFGAGVNNVTTPYVLVGGSRSTGRITITAGGTLNLANGGGKTDLTIGSNAVQGTNTTTAGEMDLTGGTLIATLGQVVIGNKSDSTNSGAGTGTGTLTLDAAANSVTADSLVLGNLSASATSANLTQGTLNFAGGTFTVANDVGLGIISDEAGANSQGTLNLTGGAFTVGGNITSTNNAKSNAVVMLDGATLDMTGGSIDANTFDVRSGALKDVSQIYNGGGSVAADLVKTTAGTLSLIGTNSYTGATLVTDGALEVRGTTGTGAVTAQTGSTVFGTGVVQGSTFTLDDGATLRPGDSVADGSHGTLTFTPATASGSTSSLQGTIVLGITGATVTDATYGGNVLGSAGYDAWVDSISGTGSHDRLVFSDPTSGSGYSLDFLTTTGSLQIVGDGFTAEQGMAFNLLDWGSLVSANFTGFTFNGGYLLGNGDEGADLDLPDLSAAGLAWDFSRFTTSGVIVIVPEPSRALLLLVGMLGLLLRRRRVA